MATNNLINTNLQLCSTVLIFTIAFVIGLRAEVLTSNKQTHVGENAHILIEQFSHVYTRKRRNLPTSEEIRVYVDKHNEFRRQEGASNMHILVSFDIYML